MGVQEATLMPGNRQVYVFAKGYSCSFPVANDIGPVLGVVGVFKRTKFLI